ncbi:hypothetical protein ABFS82_04G048400 [Erythranthe guttata]|uniref:DUF4378 domain-containing protein n=1 Tax=Erythranthe guttata TaxID=4155 RepID=A0A022S4T8_ERYGU|nr:PREDICTED: uncharacterized protein LOC105951563 isoform X1 [Erythranthe guttata]XP_012830479.1 PREDICTED: uncharacterized protein LOC105951563 isoform X1 [Erythranthe guttata]EYU46370.1 hypothetical protein MIMGU_mgv1a000965mg [Erythranthe guttata]|eukprot:XP_012830475.1 PREDICTED: uncharacterized protein LOC105951563 isoform X1 [Erythranthe guttata]
MNGIHHNGKNSNLEKKYAGCLGRMVNLFELNTEMPANRLLQDKPHADGSSLSRSRSDVSRMSLSGDSAEEKVTVSEFKSSSSNRKSNGTPMKMLIAQEMSKEIESRRDPPNLVAKLMGLDALPRQEPDSAIQRRHSRGHPRSHSEIPLSYWEQQNGFFHYVDPKEYKDVDGNLQQSQKPPHKGIYEETVIDKKMALVRQKFIEAKRLSMDEKLRQSKQFHDALEVLSSNKDLFLECLQEPDSFFSEHLYGRESVPPPRETRRITVLRPSKMADDSDISRPEKINGKQIKKGSLFQLNGLDKIHPGNSPPASSPEPTRIVVLKPTTHGKPHAVNAVGSLLSELPKILHSEDFFGDVEDEENRQSREMAKAITQQIHEKLGRHRRDETLISSVFSNGYVGDESSFNKSEIDYADGNFSDSEVMSPVSRHSWDYVNRLGSPYSSSSFTRASYSPESSVCREAKKRLSERWAMMASNGICQEQKPVRRSSSTLGEMLALSETKDASPEEEGSSSKEPMDLNSFLVSESREEGNVDYSPRNLTRSKSVPVSSIQIENRLNVSVADNEKPESPKEDVKARSVKLSFTGKVSSLFFSRNKKTGKDKSLVFGTKDEFHSGPGEIHCDRSESLGDKGSDHASSGLLEPSSNSSSSNLIGELGTISPETGFAAAKPIASGNPGENQEQPSPISVLDSPFGEDEHTEKLFRHCIKPVQHVSGVDPPHNSIGSNLIDKSPPIGSIARTLSWDDSCINTATSHPTEESLTTTHDETNENQEWSFFFKTLLSVSGLECEMQSTSFLAKWHSLESPLDPSLRDKYVDLQNENKLHEAKQRQGRSIQRLVFDCVNSALIEITGYGSDSGQKPIGDEVWALMNAWFSEDVDDCGDDTCLMVERVVRKEVVGKGWNRHFRLEIDNLGKEIEGKLLEELVQEALVEFD